MLKDQPTDTQFPADSNGVILSLKELLNYKDQTVRWLPPAKSLWSQLNGQHISRQQGRGMNFSEVRQYHAGDDIRSIDWRVTARTGKAHTKLFTEEREQPVMLYLDFAQTMRFGSILMLKSVQMAHMASLISWLAIEQKDRIGAILDSGHDLLDIKPTSRNKGALQLLHKLTDMHNHALDTSVKDKHSLSIGLEALHRLYPKGSEIVLCSDFTRFDCQKDSALLSQLRRHNRITIVQFYDPLERGQTQYRGTEKVTNGQETQWLNFSSRTTREQLANAYQLQQQQLESLCRSLAIPYYALSSAEPLIYQISGSQQ